MVASITVCSHQIAIWASLAARSALSDRPPAMGRNFTASAATRSAFVATEPSFLWNRLDPAGSYCRQIFSRSVLEEFRRLDRPRGNELGVAALIVAPPSGVSRLANNDKFGVQFAVRALTVGMSSGCVSGQANDFPSGSSRKGPDPYRRSRRRRALQPSPVTSSNSPASSTN